MYDFDFYTPDFNFDYGFSNFGCGFNDFDYGFNCFDYGFNNFNSGIDFMSDFYSPLNDIAIRPLPMIGNPFTADLEAMLAEPAIAIMPELPPFPVIDVQSKGMMSAKPGSLFYEPYDNMMSPEMAHALGILSDQDMSFLESIGPKHHEPVKYEKVEVRPVIGPSKEDWARYDSYERDRQDAVDHYNDCLSRGDMDGAERWADRARDAQYSKEVIYDVGYVTDVDVRAGLKKY